MEAESKVIRKGEEAPALFSEQMYEQLPAHLKGISQAKASAKGNQAGLRLVSESPAKDAVAKNHFRLPEVAFRPAASDTRVSSKIPFQKFPLPKPVMGPVSQPAASPFFPYQGRGSSCVVSRGSTSSSSHSSARCTKSKQCLGGHITGGMSTHAMHLRNSIKVLTMEWNWIAWIGVLRQVYMLSRK